MEIEISLEGKDGKACPENGERIYFGKSELCFAQSMDRVSADYYNRDVLTRLYARNKYERDLNLFQATGYTSLICVYIDAVGLHEINNHLGHDTGDYMLRCVADGIRKYFPKSMSYRIGGDEFVILCLNHTQSEVEEALSSLKQEIKQQGYEISTGIGASTDTKTLNEAIGHAEKAMRYDKMDFYRNNGGARQMRSLNYELEKLLLEKQDASHFLDVIAPRYKGVYMVNAQKDTCRYIYVPPYFKKILDHHKGSFLQSMHEYRQELVCPEYYDCFEKVFDYAYIQEQLAVGNTVEFRYQKLDGNWVELKITHYDQDSSDTHEMLWIFLDDNDQ